MVTLKYNAGSTACYDYSMPYPKGTSVKMPPSVTGKEFSVRRAVNVKSAHSFVQGKNQSFNVTEAEQAGMNYLSDISEHVDLSVTQLNVTKKDRLVIKLIQLPADSIKGWKCHSCLATLKIMIPVFVFHNQEKVLKEDIFKEHFSELLKNLETEAKNINASYDIDKLICILRGIKDIYLNYGNDIARAAEVGGAALKNDLICVSDKFFLMLQNVPSLYENKDNKRELLGHQREIDLGGPETRKLYRMIS